ncbi:MAG: HAD family hydrolase [Gammaproteobacteria bacterium]|nr:HAD family hydrolase [Gammaproteobacteria bacterium]
MLFCFDYDGVIVDSFDVLLRYCQAGQRAIGVGRQPRAEDLRSIGSLTFDGLAEHIGIGVADRARYRAAIFELQRMEGWPVRPFDGIESALSDLALEHRIVIVTAADSATVTRSLEQHGLMVHVTRVLGAESGTSKSERIGEAMRALRQRPDQTVMVGDAISDIREGKRAGVRTAAVAWGYQPEHLLRAQDPDWFLRQPAELTGLVELAAGTGAG